MKEVTLQILHDYYYFLLDLLIFINITNYNLNLCLLSFIYFLSFLIGQIGIRTWEITPSEIRA